MRLSRAIDLWLGELARSGRTASTRASYERYLFMLAGQLEQSRPDLSVRDVTTNDCRRFLDGWNARSSSTVCSIHSALNGFLSWAYLEGEIEANPMVRIARPRRPRPEDAEVVILTANDVQRMLAASADWQEFLCLSCWHTWGLGVIQRAGFGGGPWIWTRGRCAFGRRGARWRQAGPG
jgi:site-specific recombinase XerD